MALVAQIWRDDGVEEPAVLEPQEQVEFVRRVLAVEPPPFVVRESVPAREELERREPPGLAEGADEVERRRDGVAPPDASVAPFRGGCAAHDASGALQRRDALRGGCAAVADVAPRGLGGRREHPPGVYAERIDGNERDVLEIPSLGKLEGDGPVLARPRVEDHERGRREEVVARLGERVHAPRIRPAARRADRRRRGTLLHRLVRGLPPVLARARVQLGGLRLAYAPRREKERRTLQHVARAVRKVAAVEDVPEPVAEIAFGDVFAFGGSPVGGRRGRAGDPFGEEARELALVGPVASGDEVHARVGRGVPEPRADLPPVARSLRDAYPPRRARVRNHAVRARNRAVRRRRGGLRDPERYDAILGAQEEPVVSGRQPLDAQHPVRVRQRAGERGGACALAAVRGERRARGEVVGVRPRAGEESGDGKLERLPLDGGELGGERGKRLVTEVPRDPDGRLHLHRDDVRERAEPHASRGVRLEALRHRLREGEVAELELHLASRERLAVASAQLHRKSVRAAAE